MSLVFVDTSVLIAAENLAAGRLHAASLAWLDALWRTRSGRTGVQALVEFYQLATSAQPPLPQGDARAALRRYQSWTPWKTDAATLETAWAIEARHQLAFGDCLQLACAQHSGCVQFLSSTLAHGEQVAGVFIVNPTLQAPPAAAA